MKMTLLEWDRQGRPGVFIAPGFSLIGGLGGFLLSPILPPGMVGITDPQHFSTLRELCRYLGHGPSEIEGEVRS